LGLPHTVLRNSETVLGLELGKLEVRTQNSEVGK
jgi:hypothetical protein